MSLSSTVYEISLLSLVYKHTSLPVTISTPARSIIQHQIRQPKQARQQESKKYLNAYIKRACMV